MAMLHCIFLYCVDLLVQFAFVNPLFIYDLFVFQSLVVSSLQLCASCCKLLALSCFIPCEALFYPGLFYPVLCCMENKM